MATICPWDQELDDTEAKDLARKLKDAMQGLGTSEEEIIEVLVSINNRQRQQVKEVYSGYGDLLDDLKSELGGDFEDAIIALMTPTSEYEARLLQEAIHGPGTNENTLVAILCTRTNDELATIKDKYKEIAGADLYDDLKDDVSGPCGSMLMGLADSGRQEGDEDDEAATKEAQILIDSGIGMIGTEESEFAFTISKSSPEQLLKIMEKYAELTDGRDLVEDTASETSGPLRDGLLALLKVTKDKSAYFAERLHNAMEGIGTDENELIRILVCRAEVDLEDIKKKYKQLYDTELEDDLARETGGDFEKVLRSICRGHYVG